MSWLSPAPSPAHTMLLFSQYLLDRFRLIISLLLGLTPLTGGIAPSPIHHYQSYLLMHTPPILHAPIRLILGRNLPKERGPPIDVPELYNAKWPGAWDVPAIRPPGEPQHQDDLIPKGEAASGVWVALYVFSMPTTACRARRELIRKYHPLDTLPPALRSLVSVKFVIGYPNPDKSEDENTAVRQTAEDLEKEAIRAEEETHHDLVRLKGLVRGENMNEGKSVEWAKFAGSEGNEAQWVFKCDDDTFVLLPNLLDILLDLDPSQPTCVGTSVTHWPGYLWYNVGFLYGFSWGVARTFATCEIKKEVYTSDWHEDALMGELMYLLPSKPGCDPSLSYKTPPPGGWHSPPSNPDERSGLVRVDFGGRAGDQADWWVAGPDTAVAWHPCKKDQEYIDAYHRAKDLFVSKYGKYEWVPPKGWEDKLVWAT